MKRLWLCMLILVCCFPCVSHALTLLGGSGGVGSIQDEGTPLGSFRTINCQGAGIECADAGNGLLTISVSASGTSGLGDPGANGLVNRIGAGVTAPYAGTTCTNQVLRVLSSAGAGTCVTLTSAYVDSSIALTGGHLGQFAATTSAQLAGVLSDEEGASGGFTRTGVKLSVFAATTSAELAGVLSDEEGSTGGFVRAGGTVAAATALAANGANCSAGEAPLGVDALGAVEGCFAVLANLAGGAGIAVSGNTISTDLTKAASLYDGTAAALTCGTTNGGKFQIGPGHELQYCDYTLVGQGEEPLEPASVLRSGFLTQTGLVWAVDPLNCSTDSNGGKLTLIANTIVCSQDLGGNDLAWNDGGATALTCSGAQGAHQVMNTGRLQYCGGEDIAVLYDGYLLPSPLSWNITAAACTGDGNSGKLTVNGSNQVVCAADIAQEGGGSGTITAVGNITSGDAGTTGFPLTSLWYSGIAAPSTPAAGQGRVYLNSTSKNFCVVSDDSTVKCGVQAFTPVTNQFLTSIAGDGSVSAARPAIADLSDGASLVKLTDAQIVEGKQLVPRVCELGATSGSVTPNADTCDIVYRHDVSGQIDVQTPTATGLNPRHMHALTLSFLAASEQTITWTSAYAGNYTIALPDTLPAGKYVAFTFRYNVTSAKYELWGAHVPDVAVSSVLFSGSTSGVITVAPQAAAGTFNFNLPTSAGTAGQPLLSGGGGSNPMTWGTTTGTGDFVRGTNPTLTLANATGLPLTTGVTGDLPYANLTGATTGSKLLGRGDSGAGDWQEITVGSGLAMTGTTLSATAGASNTGTLQLPTLAMKLPSSNPAIPDSSSNTNKLLFDASTSECAIWEFQMPADYASAPVLKFPYSMTSATGSVGVSIDVAVWAVTPGDSADIDTESYDTVNNCDDATVPGTAGHTDVISCSLTNNDGLAAGDIVHVRVCRAVSDSADTASGDMEGRTPALQYVR